MTMAQDSSAAMPKEATLDTEKESLEVPNEIQEEMSAEKSTKQEQSEESSLANAFVVGTNLSLCSSTSKEAEEEKNGLIVEEEEEEEEENVSKEDTLSDTNNNNNDEAAQVTSPPPQEHDNSIVLSEHSLMDDDSHDTQDSDTNENNEEEEEEKDVDTPSSGRGAKILMNRFSSWRDKANETVNQAMKSPRFNRTTGSDESISPSSSGGSSFTTQEEESTTKTEEDYAETQRRTAVAVKVAASSVVDTVASGFRGRYSGGTPATPQALKETKQQVMTQSQTALIMQSRAKAHMQSIMDSLEPQEYVMLLGNGMLGVNLKQAYLKNNGVYIDFLVEGGSAELSGVVGIGDNLMKVGDVDVFRRGLILNVPQTIAAAKRPVVLVFSTGQDIPLERMNYIDVAVGMMHKIREDKNGHRDIASLPIHNPDEASSSMDENTSVKSEGSASAKSSTQAAENVATEETSIEMTVPPPTFDGPNPMHLATPPLALREMVSSHVAKRCYDNFSLSMLCQAATTDPNFRAVLQNAFVTCVYDGRRLPFLSSHFSYQDSYENDEESNSEEDFQMTTASTQLMLFLELTTFAELYSITPEEKRRDMAKRIAFKFFLPSKIGNSLEPPMFDFHHIVPDADLRALEHALNDTEHPVGRGVFVPFQKAVMESLSGPPFLTFLISVECARMRGYLRNTAPFQSICPGEIFSGVEKGDSTMENHFQYLLMHKICLVEREIGDEHDVLSGASDRVMGAVGGVACAIYIKKRLLNIIDEVKRTMPSESKDDDGPYCDLVEAMEVVWEAYIAPGGGMLDNVANSAETDAEVKKVREILSTAVSGSSDSGGKEMIEALTNAELIQALSSLSDHLLHDYAVNTYSKFKEHRFHEWLCNELVLEKGDSESEPSTSQDPKTGCIRRLMRKAKLPSGVSPHKPIRLEEGTNKNVTKRQNAEFAVVFGKEDGSGDVDPMPNPAMNRTDIRRYVCQSVTDEKESQSASSFRVPQTLESYMTVPLLRQVPFSEYADDSRISADGWEISLVNFMVPNADTESDNHDEKALFGVSLVFQRRGESLGHKDDLVPTSKIELVHEVSASQQVTTPRNSNGDDGEKSAAPPFASPIRFVSTPAQETGGSDAKLRTSTRVIQVSVSSPVFNRKLQEESWSRRMVERRRVVAGPITVGIALVCRRNVVLAMRETLTRFLLDHSRSSEESSQGLVCGPLVELLGNFSHPDVEAAALKAILEPYLGVGSAAWVDRPISAQKHQFEIVAGQQLLDCLPPIPLALLFVTLLLEQKVVFSSSRRSVLFSAVTSVTNLLKPLRWSHLLVPLVPSALARDLLQYPAPFILGIPSEDPGNMEVLNSLPSDVTLVDLDVGRVILASHFAHDEELVRNGEDPRITAQALRSQVLYLAQSLGLLFGSRLSKQTWNVDSPSASFTVERMQEAQAGMADIEKLQAVCRSFLVELLSGTESCCFWIEERGKDGTETECTVLFDEDRFFHIKNLRARGRYKPLFETGGPYQRKHADYDVDGPMTSEDGLALSLDDFDLILESFLRCQSMSTFVSSRPKARMAYV